MDVREKSSNGNRLIDVDEAIINFGFEWDDIPPTREEFVRFLKKQSIIDAVPVVRCRDCFYYTPVNDKIGKCVFLIGEHQYVVHDGYCYLSERKEGDER